MARNSIVQITVSELIEYGISQSYIWKCLSQNRSRKGKGSWQHSPAPWDARVKLINYDSIPAATREKLPPKQQLIEQQNAEEAMFEFNTKAEKVITLEDLHKQYTHADDNLYFISQLNDRTRAKDLTEAAGWLRLLNHYQSKKDTRKIDIDSKDELRTLAHEIILERDDKRGRHLYGFKVANLRTLHNKELDWRKAYNAVIDGQSNAGKTLLKQANQDALNTIIPGYMGSSNRQIIGKPTGGKEDILINGGINVNEWHAKELIKLYMLPGIANKLDFEEIHRRYERKCKTENIKPVGVRSVKRFLTLPAVHLFTTRERNGWASFDKLLPETKRNRPEYSLSKGGYDGFQVDFNTKFNGKTMMLTVVAVFDYMSGAITGYDVGLVENGMMVRNMYRNSLRQLNGYTFLEIESDRFSGNLMEDTRKMFEQTCRYITQPTPNDPEKKASNPKARYVERLVQELNRMAQSLDGWKGTNITSIDQKRKPNPDYRSKNYIEELNEGINQIIMLVNAYNYVKLAKFDNKSRMQMCMENMNPEAPHIEVWAQAMLLNEPKESTVRKGVVSIEVNGRTYNYKYPNYDIDFHRMLRGNKVIVYYDETDMGTIDVFGVNDEFLATLKPLIKPQEALAEQTNEDKARAAAMRADRKRMLDRVSRKALEFEASIYELDISNMDIEEARSLIMGERITRKDDILEPFEQRFAEELEEGQEATAYYQERLLIDNGMEVPVLASDDDERREYFRTKSKKNPGAATPGQSS